MNVASGLLPKEDADRPEEDAPPASTQYRHRMNELVLPLPRRVASLPSFDVALAALVAGLSLMDVWAPLSFVTRERHRPLLSVVFVAMSLALVWRRRVPLVVLAFVFTSGSLLYLAVGAPEALGTFLPPLAAIYAVGRYAEPRALVLATPVALLGTAIHEVKDPNFTLSGPAIFFWALLAAAWPVGHAFRRRALAVEELQRVRQADVAAERARIARELHDVVGHGISIVVLQVVAALGMLESGGYEAARRRLLATERSARETLAEMRRLLELLDERAAPLAPQPGLSDIERLISDAREVGVEVDLEVTGDRIELPAGLELAAYRVVQEALTNVIKHARPRRALIRVAYGTDELTVEVVDEGMVEARSLTGGRGLAGMRERVALYGGVLKVGPRTDGGFGVSARFPLALS
ncbi:MAG TPA: sensor histidine kinase [Gaiellaceae bacterium]|nr:sensor histidine kinase [Gaiellaceae bacterium]